MAKGNKKKNARDDSDDEETAPLPVTETTVSASQKRKDKRAQKAVHRVEAPKRMDDDDDDDYAPKGNQKSKGGALAKLAALQQASDDDEDEDDDDDYVPPSNKGKGGNKKKGGAAAKLASLQQGDDDEDEDYVPPSSKGKGNSRKKGGAAAKLSSLQQADDEDDDEDDYYLPPSSKGKGNNKKKGGAAAKLAALQKVNDEEDDEDEDDDNVPPPNKGKGNNKMKGGAAAKWAALQKANDDDEDDDYVPPPSKRKGSIKKNGGAAARLAAFQQANVDEDGDEDELLEDDEEEVEEVTMVLADDDWGVKSKKDKKEKKEKKDKKEKKVKKEKKHHQDEEADELTKSKTIVEAASNRAEALVMQVQQLSVHEDEVVEVDSPNTLVEAVSLGSTTAVASELKVSSSTEKKKSKFELQMEAALAKKREADAMSGVTSSDSAPTKEKKLTPKTALKELEPEPEWVDTGAPKINQRVLDIVENSEVVYGAPDDHAWTDKSAALKDSENFEDDEHNLTHGPDGKKLSNKERKKLLKAKQAADREAEYEKVAAVQSKEGAQFACSQTAVNEKDPQWENSLDITIPSFSISAAGKILFKDASLTIGHGRRYGLVGPNGRGKSTLLKMVASRDLKLPPRIDFLYVEQEVVADDTPAVEAVLRADVVRWNLQSEEAELMKKADSGDETVIERLQQVMDELNNMGADAAEAKARRILYGLGFSVEMQTKPTKMFSGGWRMRISLARALFVEPTLLMLDEPTNHLDLNAVIWLDEYLQKWKNTLLIVSHDQNFLDSLCQEILHIEDLKLISYKGNYDSFKKMEKTKFEQQVKAWEKQEKRIRELKKSGQSKTKAQETVMNSVSKRESGARSTKKQNQLIAGGSETAVVTELIKRPKEYQVRLEFVEVAPLGRPVIEVTNVHFRYSPKHPVIFDRVDFGIDMDSRICIVGPNGAGKSTLLKLLTGELSPTTGEIKRNPRLRMGIYNQHFVERLPMNKTPIEHLKDRFGEKEDYQSIRNRLGRYGLEGHAHEVTMRDLSGGQKARVVFVELSLQEPHVLLLDEPTNNLDIETIDALCDAINAFNGGIVVVTHDQRLIEECECTLWVVEKQGVTKWDRGFEDYKETILRELEEAVEAEAAIRRDKLRAVAQAKAEKVARLAALKRGNPKGSHAL